MAVIMMGRFRFLLCKIAKLQNSRSFYLWCLWRKIGGDWKKREKKEGNITGRKMKKEIKK